jgi:hypothetical protein
VRLTFPLYTTYAGLDFGRFDAGDARVIFKLKIVTTEISLKIMIVMARPA